MANLLDSASILLTPTAYNNGSILAIKPSDGSGDFTFSRGSSATRVNEQGLIEDVQILSSNLASNGDFSQGGQDWNSEQGIWTFGDSVVNGNGANGATQELTQVAVTTVGKNYNITYEVLNYVSGSVQVLGSEISYVSANGVYTSYYSASSTTFKFRAINFIGSITNISILEITDDTNLPRIDYTDGCGSLLLEPQSTNLYLNSNTLVTQSNATSASAYTVSFYGTGTITFSGTHTGTLVGTGLNDRVSVTFTATSGTLISTISGYCTKGQLENLTYPTSYIPTSGVISTRLADIANIDLTSFTLTSITETISGVEQTPITVIPSIYTAPYGSIDKIIMI